MLMLVMLVSLLGLVAEGPGVAHAATTVFTSCPTEATLRATITGAASDDIIQFNIGSPCTINLTQGGGGVIVINKNLTLDNQGQQVTISGSGTVQVFQVNNSVTFKLNALTIAHGNTFGSGGGLLNNGTVTITNSTFSENSAPKGGGLYNNDSGTVNITNSTFHDNSGSGLLNGGTVNITNSTFSDNSGNNGGGLLNGGTVNITNSTFSNNSASSKGDGLFNKDGLVTITNSTFANNYVGVGGGIFNDSGTVTITNSTFANNYTSGGGGLANGSGKVTITNSTFANNSASIGGGLVNGGGKVTITNSTFANNSGGSKGGALINASGGKYSSGVISVAQSIVANNSASTGANCIGTIADQGYNLSNDTSCGFTNSTSRQNINPQLDPAGLANNGGPTQTIALLPNSHAIDFIPAPSVCKLTSDQRSLPRPDNSESMCDIGAYEFQD